MNLLPFGKTRLLLCLGAVALLAACGGGEMAEVLVPKHKDPTFPSVQLTLAHVNDHHSQLDPSPTPSC